MLPHMLWFGCSTRVVTIVLVDRELVEGDIIVRSMMAAVGIWSLTVP